jgi:spermidine synthase
MDMIRTIVRHQGPRGEVVLRRRLGDGSAVDELIINGVFAMDSRDTSTERRLAELAVPSGQARRVLVGGLGLGYTVAAIAALDVEVIDVIEIEQCLIDWAYQGITPSLAAVAADPRVQLHAADIRPVLDGTIDALAGPWDAIVLDVDNGPDFLIHQHNRALYAEEGLKAAYAQLASDGTLAIWSQGPVPALRRALEHIATSVTEHVIEVSRGERRLCYAIYTVRRGPHSVAGAR